MTVADKNTANCIDEAIVIILIVNESIVHKLLQCLDITPIVCVIRLHSVYPIKDPAYDDILALVGELRKKGSGSGQLI